MFLRSEDAEVFGDEGTSIQLCESGGVEAESSNCVGDGLQDLNIEQDKPSSVTNRRSCREATYIDERRNVVLDSIIQRFRYACFLDGSEASRLIMNKSSRDIDS